MKHSILISLLTFFCISFSGYGQEKGLMEFELSDHDFGEIKEENGPVTYEFVFENKGKEPIVISRVKASCGCTTPAWSKDPVLPGEKGFIKAQYNPRNRPGTFRKTLTVTSNAEKSVTYLYIKGKVIPRVRTPEERMPYAMGGLRLKSRVLNFSKISTKEPVDKEFPIYNSGIDTIRFIEKVEGRGFVSIAFEKEFLAPKEEGKLIVTYDAKKENVLGLRESSVSFYTDEPKDAKKDLVIKASVYEYFAPLSTEEKEKAPRLKIQERMKDLGTLSKGSKKSEEFFLTNSGKKTLNIRKVESNCACLSAVVSKENVKSGETISLTVTFDSTGRRGRQTKSVAIYSNDPLDPTQMVTVKTSVTSN